MLRPVVSFSGGQQRRLLLAKLLLAAPDIMLLDEPSNHLDMDATRGWRITSSSSRKRCSLSAMTGFSSIAS